jgi:hypothetical protein
MQDLLYDRRLAAVTAADGSIDCAAVEALLRQPPGLLEIPELEAMQVVFDEVQFWPNNPVAHVAFTRDWLEAFHRVIGGTITREKVRHGEIVERSVQHHRGRADVQAYRAQQLPPIVSTSARPLARRRGAGRPRATASRSSAGSGDSGDDGESSDDGDAWPGGFSFRAYDELISTELAGHVRLRLFHALPERWQREAWDRESATLDRRARR